MSRYLASQVIPRWEWESAPQKRLSLSRPLSLSLPLYIYVYIYICIYIHMYICLHIYIYMSRYLAPMVNPTVGVRVSAIETAATGTGVHFIF